ncbi:LYSINE-SPECIFIC DEMETHYLASE [Salix viminalis]|uniref:LYSINE-SPECIFIC DEMETHYLASE n=1 Tax=Salix viminalis TaxID=40686 RepID=A0A9Q0QC08_SALVM|nr:LYSINE-SPECIFIC DEMETHYLASE [Salix viminalis]
MGKGKPRAVEKGVLGQNLSLLSSSSSGSSSSGSLHVPSAPVYYPNEEEFKDPLEYIYKIRPEAEAYGICKIVPPNNWKPPFALNLENFSFPTKTQAIHQLQVRPASCDSKTFELEYNRFLEEHCGKKLKRRVIFEGDELDLCKLFNGVKRFGGYDKVVKEKKWGEVSRFVRSGRKITECAKHVLCQLYQEHLYDYEEYYNRLNKGVAKGCKRRVRECKKSDCRMEFSRLKRRRKNSDGEKVKVCNKVEEEEEHDQICEQCRSGLHGEVMLLCDRCNKGWHIYCLSPPLKQVPPGNWYCFECLNSDKDTFGFVPGKRFTVEAFRRLADRAKRRWFGSGSTSRVQMEKKFWEIVEGSAGDVEVMYGSDLDTSVYGSGFPRANDQRPESVEANLWDEYCGSPWNLNNLPKLKGSMLQAVHHNITGVMVPWLYVGMLFSSFCWHFEDHCFYSMNYLHWGEPKCWYSVPGSEAGAFEKVMRSSLPDLFDAQPDLLFQLVTMLNPSVLQDNRVPVYTVLQEPGNFVITFPRSYHGGFNFGLNCAEAVNFAPADWLPHGGFGAELYKTYLKTAVLSHEELLCVVAKGDCDSKASPHIKKEMLRIYTKEKSWRERIWRSGIIKSSPMPMRKCPEYVGTEEDPACIICKQYLYLSAVVCSCRPSAFVCLEHWERICECKSRRRCLLYRHTLAELSDLVFTSDSNRFEERSPSNNLRRQISCSNESNVLTKKVKGGHVSLAELAEQWLSRANKFFHHPYLGDACATLLKEAEQFLWAGPEMDPVRDMVKSLNAAQKWAGGIRDCLLKVQNWSSGHSCDLERVPLEYIAELLNYDPMPCNEPGHLILKERAEEAWRLAQEIDSALSSCSEISMLESLYSRFCDLPIYVKESKKLSEKIASAKIWIDSAKKCISETQSAAVDIDILHKLKSEISELQIQLPETELLLDLVRKAESCQSQCKEILKAPFSLKNVEVLLQEFKNFTVNIPELMVLKQCHIDAVSWISRCNDVLVHLHSREDQDKVVNELNCLLKDGASLRIQVDELPLVELELKKACCREKVLKARDIKMPIDSIQQLMMEAFELQIEKEKLFVDLSGEAQMLDFEDIIRISADIPVLLPSLDDIEDAVAMAKSWVENSAPFLVSSSSVISGSVSSLKLEVLKGLVSHSKLLKVSLDERRMLEMVMKNCDEWQQDASSALQDARCILSTDLNDDGKYSCLLGKVEHLATRMESICKAGLSLSFDFAEIPKLQNACSMLRWCSRALSFCTCAPSLEDVESLMEAAENLSVISVSGTLWSALIDGVKWLRKALGVISLPGNFERCKLSDAEAVLAESQSIHISFPLMVNQLVNAIHKHKLWLEQAERFFSLNSKERSWSLILELKELGKASAFSYDRNSLADALQKVKQSLDISLNIYGRSWSTKPRKLCICYTGYKEEKDFLTCSMCKDCYHLRCLESALVKTNNAEVFICHYCQFFDDGSISQNGGGPLKYGEKQPELRMLIELLYDSENFLARIGEKDLLQQIVEQAHECKKCLREILDFALSYLDKDLTVVCEKLTIALKATEVAGVCDNQDKCDLELASARNSWRVRGKRLLEDAQKPTMQHVQRHMKEGLAMSIPPEDYIWQKLAKLKDIGLQWADHAKKVGTDSGALGLDKVFELISEGENLPIYLEKELKLLRARSMLYCICRKPFDNRAKVVCKLCGEWYHIECIKLLTLPKIYFCAACEPQTEGLSVSLLADQERSTNAKSVEPKTPSPRHTKSRKKPCETESIVMQTMLAFENHSNVFSHCSGIDWLKWKNRKPLRRTAKKRTELKILSQFFHRQGK